MTQVWHDLLFAHWPLAPASVRKLVPPELGLDLFDGSAWIGLVPFRMSGIRLRGLPPVPCVAALPELNLRTYIEHRGRRGVWFFTLEASNALAVAVARRWFHLPYHHAHMQCSARGEDVEYASRRIHRGAPPAELRARYGPSGPVFTSRAGSLEHWLTERYCLFTRTKQGQILRGDIHHGPWPLQPAWAKFEHDSLLEAEGFEAQHSAPHLLFARRIETLEWSPVAEGPSP